MSARQAVARTLRKHGFLTRTRNQDDPVAITRRTFINEYFRATATHSHTHTDPSQQPAFQAYFVDESCFPCYSGERAVCVALGMHGTWVDSEGKDTHAPSLDVQGTGSVLTLQVDTRKSSPAHGESSQWLCDCAFEFSFHTTGLSGASSGSATGSGRDAEVLASTANDRDGMPYLSWLKARIHQFKRPTVVVVNGRGYHRAPRLKYARALRLPGKQGIAALQQLLEQELQLSSQGHVGSATQIRVPPGCEGLVGAWRQLVTTRLVELGRSTELEAYASERGHRVLFVPRGHSELQPLQSVFARVRRVLAGWGGGAGGHGGSKGASNGASDGASGGAGGAGSSGNAMIVEGAGGTVLGATTSSLEIQLRAALLLIKPGWLVKLMGQAHTHMRFYLGGPPVDANLFAQPSNSLVVPSGDLVGVVGAGGESKDASHNSKSIDRSSSKHGNDAEDQALKRRHSSSGGPTGPSSSYGPNANAVSKDSGVHIPPEGSIQGRSPEASMQDRSPEGHNGMPVGEFEDDFTLENEALSDYAEEL